MELVFGKTKTNSGMVLGIENLIKMSEREVSERELLILKCVKKNSTGYRKFLLTFTDQCTKKS